MALIAVRFVTDHQIRSTAYKWYPSSRYPVQQST